MSGVDELLRDLSGVRLITAVGRIHPGHPVAPRDLGKEGALLVKIDDDVVCFHLGVDDPGFVDRERVEFLRGVFLVEEHPLLVDEKANRSSWEFRNLLRVTTGYYSWDEVPQRTYVELELVVDFAEPADVKAITYDMTEVTPPVMVTLMGRCTCQARSASCVDVLYALDEVTGMCVMSVGVIQRGFALDSAGSVDRGFHRPVFELKFDRAGWEAEWLRGVG